MIEYFLRNLFDYTGIVPLNGIPMLFTFIDIFNDKEILISAAICQQNYESTYRLNYPQIDLMNKLSHSDILNDWQTFD